MVKLGGKNNGDLLSRKSRKEDMTESMDELLDKRCS